MNKKKVKELLQDADICFLGYERNGCRDLVSMGLQKLHEAQEELSKSDWVSVEDGLPPYEEVVNVRIDCGEGGNELNEHIITYGSTHRVKSKDNCSHLRFDKNNFVIDYDFETITHWKPIEKLEDL